VLESFAELAAASAPNNQCRGAGEPKAATYQVGCMSKCATNDLSREKWLNWRASLKWQRLNPYEKFADMIDRHWDGIAAYCKPENKVSLGFVEGLNNKIRVIQGRAYGIRDEEYLRLKILTCMLPML